jgi:hypothetical protein
MMKSTCTLTDKLLYGCREQQPVGSSQLRPTSSDIGNVVRFPRSDDSPNDYRVDFCAVKSEPKLN